MVYDSKSLIVLHKLTPKGEKEYRAMLEREADELLFAAQHPVKSFFKMIIRKIFDV